LFWRVFLVNAALLIVAAVLLAVSPATVSFPVTRQQLLVLGIGLVVVLGANALLLRASLTPLRELSRLMQRVDLLVPGHRLPAGGARELRRLIGSFNGMLDRLELERRASSSRVVGDQEEERRRLARELHDEVGQGLTALLLQLKNTIEEAPPELASQLLDLQTLARSNLDEVRRIARQLRPTVLDDLGLSYGLESLIDVFERSTNLRFARRIALDLPRLPPIVELTLYRIAQEALTNVVRHAAADRVEVELRTNDDGDRLLLAVRDDGRGMVYAADLENGGIRGMRERALTVGAKLEIRSRPGGGTSVTAAVPARQR
jgi:two-component system sensor histidine kinase UhpB